MENIDYAVTRLTETHTEQTEAGPTEWPPLITWLDRSVTEVVKRGGAGTGGAGIPIDFEALRLLDRIKRETAWIREALYMPRRAADLLADVREAWKRCKTLRLSGDVPDDQWESIGDAFQDWAHAIIAEQGERPRKMELTVPCPACDTRWILEDDERKSAVVIEFGEGRAPVAECRAEGCEKLWAGWEQVSALGLTIGAMPDLEILEACGIDTSGIIARAREAV